MSNYIEYNDRIAFHPGYYIKEIIDESGITQEDFAKRLDTTPKNLSVLISGKQKLSVDIAMKLSRMLGTSIEYWLNLQKEYDTIVAEFESEQLMVEERKLFKKLDYKYFRDNFKLPDFPRKIDEQIKAVREFLDVSTLSVFNRRDIAVNFRESASGLNEINTIKANIMVQIAINQALEINAPKFNREKFNDAIEYALTLTMEHEKFYPKIYAKFREAGVILVILPNLSGAKINGATKKIGNNIMLMVNDRRLYSDTFWFTLLHEIGHIINKDYGISFEKEIGEQEQAADEYAANKLIPVQEYAEFLKNGQFNKYTICEFAEKIRRDPAIVLGRLQKDKIVPYDDRELNGLKHKYRVKINLDSH